ncbi:hypothetical protein IQ260_11065 [Leptolyngbya cf. ectocarpi LEGE 11479]|uniref:Uncharacterized protein n=1 Tax=Leptolyngbya cf. ectocarpi LEGE 11479 TaxID=1828722 RepID=A0A928ZTE7_LEPEC|nr:hypothetical protein [Leptolyngbya ectocarpi]MBE9067196.1 hypothetical protein [Leptolyngbya cf. ectocarpi LEGE 11479]
MGVAIAPGSAAQNDAIYLHQCRFDGCTYGVAVGSTQARGCHISNSSFYRAFSAITTIDFGTGTASLVNLTSNQYKDCRMLYRLTSSYVGPCSISGDYCENVIRLGTFGLITSVNASNASVSFQGCNYNFENAEVPYIGTLGVIVNNSMILKFKGCTFLNKSSPIKKKENDSKQSEISSKHEILNHQELSPVSELHLLLVAPNFGKFIFDGCSFRFPTSEEFDNIRSNAVLREPPIRITPYPNPYSFNYSRQAVSFRDCIVRAHDSPSSIQLSDELPIVLNNIEPRRVPIHWSTRSIRILGGLAGEQTVSIRNTLKGDDPDRLVSLPIVKLDSIKVADDQKQLGYNGKLQILNLERQEAKKDEQDQKNQGASLMVGDRLFWFSRFDPMEGHYAGTGPNAVKHYPIAISAFTVTKAKVSRTVDKNIVSYTLAAEAEVPTDTTGNKPRAPYRDEVFPLNVTSTDTSEEDSYKKLRYLSRAVIMPRSDFGQPENSQYYVILNGSVQGKFKHGSTIVTEVTNIHLLQIGDFVNQDYVPSGTRIRDISPTDLTIELTESVKLSGTVSSESVVDHVPFCYVR